MTAPWKSPEHRLRRKKFNEELAVVGKMCRLHPKGKCMPATIGEIAKEAQGQSFSNDYFQSMSRPCVYMFLKDNHPLYIGSSIQGLWRFGVPTHHRAAIRNECDETYVLWLDGKTEEQVRQ